MCVRLFHSTSTNRCSPHTYTMPCLAPKNWDIYFCENSGHYGVLVAYSCCVFYTVFHTQRMWVLTAESMCCTVEQDYRFTLYARQRSHCQFWLIFFFFFASSACVLCVAADAKGMSPRMCCLNTNTNTHTDRTIVWTVPVHTSPHPHGITAYVYRNIEV